MVIFHDSLYGSNRSVANLLQIKTGKIAGFFLLILFGCTISLWELYRKRTVIFCSIFNRELFMTLREYLQGQISLIPENSNIVNPNVNNNPKIVFVNGHWSKVLPGPSEGGQNYWFDGTTFFNSAASSFNLTTWENKFADGSKWLLNSASDRKQKGSLWAQNNYNDLISHSPNVLDFYFVCHSQGCAFAAGMAEYLKSRGHRIKQLLFLSCHQGSGIAIDNTFSVYQMVYAKWVTLISSTLSALVMDLVVGDHRVKGAKYGVIVRNDLDVQYLHGQSNSSEVFPEIADLRNVMIIDVLGTDGHTYTGQSTVPNHTVFYSINSTIIQTNLPGFH